MKDRVEGTENKKKEAGVTAGKEEEEEVWT